MALSISSTTTVLASCAFIISEYFLSADTRLLAMSTKPKQSSSPSSSRVRAFMTLTGRKVALPPFVSLRYLIAFFASASLSTTTN